MAAQYPANPSAILSKIPREQRTAYQLYEDTTEGTPVSPDGRRIVSGGRDGTVRVWDAETEQELAQLGRHTGWVGSVAYCPDGRRIVSGGYDETVQLWYGDIEYLLNLANSLIQRNPPVFQADERARFGFDEWSALSH